MSHHLQVAGVEGCLERTEEGMVKPCRMTPSAHVFKIKLQDPEHIKKFYRLHERAPKRGLDGCMLIKRKAMGKTGKMVAMVGAPLLLRCHVPQGKSRLLSLPWMSFKHNVIEMDENANVTFGVKEYPPWVLLGIRTHTDHAMLITSPASHPESFLSTHASDEEAISGRDLRGLSQDGADWDGGRPGALRHREEQVGRQHAMWESRKGVGATSAASREDGAQAEEPCTPSDECGRLHHRGDRGGRAAVRPQLASVSGEVERISPFLGGLAPAGPRVCRRPSGELGARHEADRDASFGTVGCFDIDHDCIMRSCHKCGGSVRRFACAPAGIICDGSSHKGDSQLAGQAFFPCYTCALDWCVPCAAMLQPTAGADVIRIKLRYDTSASEEPTLKLGWAHAVSRQGVVAGSGPRERRDHGHLVPRAKLEEVQHRCRTLEGEVISLQSELKVRSSDHEVHRVHLNSRITRTHLSSSASTSTFDSPPPLMAPLKDSCKRASHDERRAYQVKYCTTKLVNMKREVEQAKDEAAMARKRAAEVTNIEQRKRSKLQQRLSVQRAEHAEDVNELMAALRRTHSQEMELQKARLQEKHEAEVHVLERALQEQALTHGEQLKRLREELLAQSWNRREQMRQSREEVLSSSTAKLERLRAEWEREWEIDRQRWEQEKLVALEALKLEETSVQKSIEREKVELERARKRLTGQVATMCKQLAKLQKEKESLSVQIAGERSAQPGRPVLGLQGNNDILRAKLKSLCDRLQLRSAHLPSIHLTGDASAHLDRHSNSLFFYNVQFVAAALRDRHPSVIAAALRRNNQMEPLFGTKEFQPLVKQTLRTCLDVLQCHWSARHAVILMSEVHTSRPEFDALRHLLSFMYNRGSDKFERITVWSNPTDPTDKLFAPTLATRKPRERERSIIYGKCSAESSEDGLYSGVADLEYAMAQYVTHYWSAIDPAVQQGQTPLMLVLTGDATGGWRGDAITHGELGIGSWAAGKAQSRLTLLPIFLMEGEDSAENLRSRMDKVAAAYNAMKEKGSLTITIDGKPLSVKIKLLVAADFQFFKAVLNMSKYTSAIWCTCQLDAMYKSPAAPVATWQEVGPCSSPVCQ